MNDRPSEKDADLAQPGPEDLATKASGSGDEPPDSGSAFDALIAASSRQIGPYKLLQEIGIGGMGTVWLAEQERPVRRRVAVKLIKAGRADKQIMARFEAERQALSMMDHPHIAKVLDAGTADGGNPYFVMELVQGDPITKYCDRHKLTPLERLKLFLPVCDAIQHAHQKGIIHRDLKPSNVLVHVHQGKPIPKVIDFGLAKALQHQTKLTDKTIFTEFGQIVGTVQYMSPEQARMDAIDIDTRTDIYSLGVMLYELMAGSTPLDEDTIQQHAVLQLLEIIREKEPPRPSQRLSSSTEKLTSISEQRNVQPAKLQQILRGDLDWIIIKSLEKDRTRRYATPHDFAEDIGRYLRGDAVEARPPTTGYRIRKFIRKHRALVGSVGLFMALLTAGIAATTTFAVKANRARQEAEASRIEAEKSAKRSEDVLKIVTDAYQSVDPASGADATMTAKDVLLKAQDSLKDSDLDDEGRLALLQKLSTCFLALGEYDSAVSVAEESLRLSKAQLGGDHPALITSMSNLAGAYLSAGRLAEALPLYEQALQLCQSQLGEEHPQTLIVMNNLARAYEAAGQLDGALMLKEQTLRMSKAKLGDDHPQTLGAMNNLARAYELAGRLQDALPLNEQMLRMSKAKLGDDHPYTLGAMNNLAGVYESAGRLQEALRLKEQTLRLCKAKFGSEHPNTLIVMNGMGVAYQKVGRLDEALPLFEQAFRLGKATLGADHPDTLFYMGNVAGAYEQVGRSDEALPLREELVQLSKAKLGEKHHDTLHFMNDLAYAYQRAGHLDEALQLYEQTLQLRKAVLGDEHPQTLNSMSDLAYAYELDGRTDDAKELLEEMLAKPSVLRNDGWSKFDIQSQYGGIALQLGRIEEAVDLLINGYEDLQRVANSIPAPYRNERLTRALERLIKLAEAQQQPEDVVRWQKKLDELNK